MNITALYLKEHCSSPMKTLYAAEIKTYFNFFSQNVEYKYKFGIATINKTNAIHRKKFNLNKLKLLKSTPGHSAQD